MLALLLLAACARTPAPAATPEPWDADALRAWAEVCEDWDEWDRPGPPARVFGNTWLVGTCGIGSVLITGEQGHVLIDSGTRAGADVVAANVEALGFELSDVERILVSHEHFDHVGGVAELKRRTGAKLLAHPVAAAVLEAGEAAADDPQAGALQGFEGVAVDGLLEDGVPVRVGELALTPVFTPGHTAGAVSWQWTSCSGQACAQVVYADSLSAVSADGYRFSEHPDWLEAWNAGLDRLGALDCDVVLTPHPSHSDQRARFATGSPLGAPDCGDYAADRRARLAERLTAEAAE